MGSRRPASRWTCSFGRRQRASSALNTTTSSMPRPGRPSKRTYQAFKDDLGPAGPAAPSDVRGVRHRRARSGIPPVGGRRGCRRGLGDPHRRDRSPRPHPRNPPAVRRIQPSIVRGRPGGVRSSRRAVGSRVRRRALAGDPRPGVRAVGEGRETPARPRRMVGAPSHESRDRRLQHPFHRAGACGFRLRPGAPDGGARRRLPRPHRLHQPDAGARGLDRGRDGAATRRSRLTGGGATPWPCRQASRRWRVDALLGRRGGRRGRVRADGPARRLRHATWPCRHHAGPDRQLATATSSAGPSISLRASRTWRPAASCTSRPRPARRCPVDLSSCRWAPRRCRASVRSIWQGSCDRAPRPIDDRGRAITAPSSRRARARGEGRAAPSRRRSSGGCRDPV